MIRLETSAGNIDIELDSNTPITTNNFMQYVKDGFYDGTIFHRVINDFMIQGGGFTADMEQKTTLEPIQNEANLGGKNLRGTLAMARTMAPHSASSQFFINVKDNAFLDFTSEDSQGWGYCVFGKVTAGMDVIDAIKGVATTSANGHQDVPTEPITIQRAQVIDD